MKKAILLASAVSSFYCPATLSRTPHRPIADKEGRVGFRRPRAAIQPRPRAKPGDTSPHSRFERPGCACQPASGAVWDAVSP